MDVTLYGLDESVYTRIVRLVLHAKGLEFDLVETDPFEGGTVPEGYDLRHPFKRIPAIEIDGVRLYETDAIVHYIDAIVEPFSLTPTDVEMAARMRQLMRIIDNYGYRPLVWGIYVPLWWRDGEQPSSESIEHGRRVLRALEGFVAASPGAAFADPTLATFYLASVLAAADSVAIGSNLIDEQPRLREWWNGVRTLPILASTRSQHTKF
ncbi:Glutathione S-transferase [Phyllobacterium sp. YR620]|uniref:glutathione S-transferase family protein n=1 Tax=Phyllobacterium sp. YR620 TaxID=1881066 RepID=UPI00088DCB5F|nr:glutathione S-transferase family protein [Phyllobacterium sp. YR620]SDP57394.1 Glutathione S-transferase [Phyllobacterium sp. YR620]